VRASLARPGTRPRPKAASFPAPVTASSLRVRPQLHQLRLQSQSFSRSYGSILPTSLTYICLCDQRLFTLETCCGYRYGLARKSITHSAFQGPANVHWTPRETRGFPPAESLSPDEPFPGTRLLNKKRALSPGLWPASPSSFALPLSGRRPGGRRTRLSVSRYGNINPFPFRRHRRVSQSVIYGQYA
jgi:hypothetical protein